jgi:hypothetical protein
VRTPRAEAILDALPEEVVVGLAEVLLELTERRIARAATRAESEDRRTKRARDEARHLRAL